MDADGPEQLVDFYLTQFQMSKHAINIPVQGYLTETPIAGFPVNWMENPWALHPVQLIPMIWAFVLRDVSLAKRRQEVDMMLETGGSAQHSTFYLAESGSFTPSDWRRALRHAQLRYNIDASGNYVLLRYAEIGPELLVPPSLYEDGEYYGAFFEGTRARSMLTKFYDDEGLTDIFPSSASYAVSLVLANRPDADTDEGFAALCLMLSTAGSHKPGGCVSDFHLPPVWSQLLLAGSCGIFFCFGVWFLFGRQQTANGGPRSKPPREKYTSAGKKSQEVVSGRTPFRGSSLSFDEPDPSLEGPMSPPQYPPVSVSVAKKKQKTRAKTMARCKDTRHETGLGCSICLESYSVSAGVVPRMLITCGHEFCEGCLDMMLQPVRLKNRRKQLECPTCRGICPVRGGRAAWLPIVYAIQQA
jgi:hypothetical protein